MTIRARNRRRFQRFPCEGRVAIEGAGDPGRLLDLSLHGLLMECPLGYDAPPGTEVSLTIVLPGAETPIRMTAAIVHAADERIGLRCVNIDLDSVCELRRLVECNLGDEALLQREFDALVL